MSIGTKNNALILKSGSLARNCACCLPSNPPCSTCTEGQLPDTVTVTFSGFQDSPPGSSSNTLCCNDHYGGKSFVLSRGFRGDWCVYGHRLCGVNAFFSVPGVIRVFYRGPNLPPTVTVVTEDVDSSRRSQSCDVTLTAGGNITNCSQFSFTATNAAGVTATVTPGGTYDQTYLNKWCHPCCRGNADRPSEVSISISGASGDFSFLNGTYVVPLAPQLSIWQISRSAQDAINRIPGLGGGIIGLRAGIVQAFGCNQCNANCIIEASVTSAAMLAPPGSPFAGATYPQIVWSTARGNNHPCRSTPACAPYGSGGMCPNFTDFTGCISFDIQVA